MSEKIGDKETLGLKALHGRAIELGDSFRRSLQELCQVLSPTPLDIPEVTFAKEKADNLLADMGHSLDIAEIINNYANELCSEVKALTEKQKKAVAKEGEAIMTALVTTEELLTAGWIDEACRGHLESFKSEMEAGKAKWEAEMLKAKMAVEDADENMVEIRPMMEKPREYRMVWAELKEIKEMTERIKTLQQSIYLGGSPET